MRIPRIYQAMTFTKNSIICLEEMSAHYVTHVLRLSSGAPVILFNGDGNEYHGRLVFRNKHQIEVNITEIHTINRESPTHVHLGQVISKSEAMDFTLQKTTELGVSEITPLYAQHTQFKQDPRRLEQKMRHWRKIIISACEQCGRNTLPRLHPPQALSTWITTRHETTKLFADLETSNRLTPGARTNAIAVLIGAEGGYTSDEIALIHAQAFIPISLGPRILRTETAGMAIIAILQQHGTIE
jgi:16S rRNA (uracil1498-N3)-methyltransferase